MIRWPWTPRHIGPPDETTQDRLELLMEQKRKLRRAEALAARLRAEDETNHYMQRIRRSMVLEAAQEGAS